MASRERKTESGRGGKLGHSAMSHWDYTEIIKQECKKARRVQDKRLCRLEQAELLREAKTLRRHQLASGT